MPEVDELFDAAFLEAAQRLRLVARRVAPRGRFADQRSRDRGAGLEFQDYRPYAAGDDLRAIDWTVYRRLGRVFLRLFEEHEDLPLYLLPETSGKGRLMELASRMATGISPPEGRSGTDLRQALKRFRALGLREGLVVVVSDFFDPAGLEAATEALGGLRHRLLLVQLVRAADRDPIGAYGGGDLRLVDAESGEAHDVSLDAAALQRYQARYDAFAEGLAALARRRGAGLLALDADAPVVPQLATLFENGRFDV